MIRCQEKRAKRPDHLPRSKTSGPVVIALEARANGAENGKMLGREISWEDYGITRTISLDLQGTQIDIWYDLGKVHFCFLPELLSFNTVSPRKQRQWCLDAQKVSTKTRGSNDATTVPRIVPRSWWRLEACEVVSPCRGRQCPCNASCICRCHIHYCKYIIWMRYKDFRILVEFAVDWSIGDIVVTNHFVISSRAIGP